MTRTCTAPAKHIVEGLSSSHLFFAEGHPVHQAATLVMIIASLRIPLQLDTGHKCNRRSIYSNRAVTVDKS